MATSINFSSTDKNTWEASFKSDGNCTAMEINREKSGTLLVYGNLEGMEKVLLMNFGPGADRNQILKIEVPAEVSITIESYTEVRMAKII